METLNGRKILYVITKSNWGGAQAYVYMLATSARQKGASVAVALGGTGEAGAAPGLLAKKLTDAGIRIVFLESFMRDVVFLQEWCAFRELLRIVKREAPDVLHVTSSKAGGLGALAGRFARVAHIVFTSHGLAFDEKRPMHERVAIWVATWFTCLLVDTTIVISKDTAARARQLPFCRRKVRLIYNGIAPQTLKERDEARRALLPAQATAKELWIGTIAELTHNKALDTLVRAAALLKRRGCAYTLCIIGTGEERHALEALIRAEDVTDSVHLLGFVEHAGTYLKAFDLFTLVSTKEGLPYVLLEAGYAGCAVIGTRIPGIMDIIDETTGLLVEARNPRALSDALETLLGNETQREALSKNLRARVAETFSLDRMLERTFNTYH